MLIFITLYLSKSSKPEKEREGEGEQERERERESLRGSTSQTSRSVGRTMQLRQGKGTSQPLSF